MSRSEKPAEFFVDRSLGKSIVEGLRDAGLTVHSMADIYGEKRAQLLEWTQHPPWQPPGA